MTTSGASKWRLKSVGLHGTYSVTAKGTVVTRHTPMPVCRMVIHKLQANKHITQCTIKMLTPHATALLLLFLCFV